MAKRFTDTNIYRKSWFREVGSQYRDVWFYLISESDASGVWEINDSLFEFILGVKYCYDDLKSKFGDRIEQIDVDKLQLTGFIEFQYGAFSDKSKAHIGVRKILSKHGLAWPEVEMPLKQSFRRQRSRITKIFTAKIFARDSFECGYCGGRDSLLLDHIKPICNGGSNERDNLMTCCQKCNTSKSTNELGSWFEKLKKSDPQDCRLDNISNLLDRLSNLLDSPKAKDKAKAKDKDKDKDAENFDAFWKVWPNRKDKHNARKVFDGISPDENLLKKIVVAVKARVKTEDWTKEGGKYIPGPAKWLRGRNWEDEVKTVSKLDGIPQSLISPI